MTSVRPTQPDERGVGDVHAAERSFHDEKVLRAGETAAETEAIRRAEARFIKLMGVGDRMAGMHVLECGCGIGRLTVALGEHARCVTSFDLSMKSVEIARERCRENGVANVSFDVCAMEQQPYGDETFDLAVGFLILHHLADLQAGIREVSRVLKPGGIAVFAETSARNRLLMFFRRHVSGRFGIPRLSTPDEHPLTEADFEAMREAFDGELDLVYPHFRFFGKLYFVFSTKHNWRVGTWLDGFCNGIDAAIGFVFPFLKKYSYTVLVRLVKRSG